MLVLARIVMMEEKLLMILVSTDGTGNIIRYTSATISSVSPSTTQNN